MPGARRRFRYRFTFFQRQFLSHLIVSLLILSLLSAGFIYFMEKQFYKQKTEELSSIARAIVRLVAKEEEDPAVSLQTYRGLLSERKVSFILLDKYGELVYRDPRMPKALSGRPFLDRLRGRVLGTKEITSFTIVRNTDQPLVIYYKSIKPKSQKGDLQLFVISPLQGIQATLVTLDQALIYIIAFVFLLAVAVSWLISRNMSRSIRSLRLTTRQLASGIYSARSPVNRSDELGELARDFNSMADQLEQSAEKLKQFETRRRHFITDVTHELRTPLTSIRGIIEGLKNGFVHKPEEQLKYYGIIEKETFRLIRLINELLDMEKIESGLITLHKKTSPLIELFEFVSETLDVLIEEKRLHLVIECQPELRVYGDYDRLTQIVINLVKNSIQFTDYGTIRLTGIETEDATMITVADTGRGMSTEELALIWERFYKADPSRSKTNSETGLGLSIVKQLVEAHDGSIEVNSTAGLGSTFTVTLPKRAPSVEPEGGNAAT
ncbi:HAMP domain-containing sensor histidine kinase [Paenibacillus filicis]|uniref:histidine kinase n=1 Tax=Paenibacillus gyeongsangnamensis TaxID=3388067 RepID=A0ABT4Q9Z3_9BACL|nr:HAMP domain-containing sensor histidine kinase [Paenibacillus filicis]MCZ8513658.1 HAMP domain-containing sensor histidine kinase [Paenibacillus filicis]